MVSDKCHTIFPPGVFGIRLRGAEQICDLKVGAGICSRDVIKSLGLQMVGRAALLSRPTVSLGLQTRAAVLGDRFSLASSSSGGTYALTTHVLCLGFPGATLGGYGRAGKAYVA